MTAASDAAPGPIAARAPLDGALRAFPGVVCVVASDGTVLDSNGCLEREVGRAVVGTRFGAIVDEASSGAKWERLLAGARGAPGGVTWELVLAGEGTPAEPRAFSAIWDRARDALVLVEHPRDPRLDDLREQVVDVNSEIAGAQRELLRERSRLRRTLAELERSNRALDEFAHAVSHDLKAPLRSIVNYATWLEEDAGPLLPDDARAHVAGIRAQGARMRALIDGLLDYARAGRVRGAVAEVDVAALVRDVVATLDPPPRVAITVDDDLPTPCTDPVPLRQVLQNLVGNAIAHAAAAEPRVHVGARRDGAWVEFSVADNGRGIPERQHDRIWTLFHSLGAGADGTSGTGIGLAIVRRLVEAEGGRAWVESAEGAGATFRFRWPMHSDTRGSGGG